jgi:hypothetical protein
MCGLHNSIESLSPKKKITLKLNMGSLSPLHQLIALNNILKEKTHNTLNGQNNFHYYIVLHIMFHFTETNNALSSSDRLMHKST